MLDNIKMHYNLMGKATQDGWVYLEVRKGMFILPQARLLLQEVLKEYLTKHRYTQSKLTPSFWEHHTKPSQFCRMVDDFGVKYSGRES